MLNDIKEVRPEYFEYRAVMLSMDAVVSKVINEEEWPTQLSINVFWVKLFILGQLFHPSWVIFVLPGFVEDLQLIQCRLCVIIFASLDLQCEVLLRSLMLD